MPGGGETEEKPSGWTVDTLHAHMARRLWDMQVLLDERAARVQKAVDDALGALSLAGDRVDAATDERLKILNEFRQTVADLLATMMPRAEAMALITALSDRLVAQAQANAEQIARLERRLDRPEARREGADALWQYAVAAIGVIALIIGVVSFFNAG